MRVLGTTMVEIGSFIKRLDRKKELFLPPHQKVRGDVWGEGKKKAWWKRLETCKGMLPGLIVTYRLKGDPEELTYLNDGANRVIYSIKAYITTMESQGRSSEAICDMLGATIAEQFYEYSDEQEAVNHYVDLNTKGAMATPYEILQCKFVTGLKDFEYTWRPIFEDLHTSVASSLALVAKVSSKPPARESLHKLKRDDLSLFCRFLLKEKARWSPTVCNLLLSDSPSKLAKQSEVENRLLEAFQALGVEKTREELGNFKRFLRTYTAMFMQTWEEVGHSALECVNPTAVRWWYSLALYHKNNDFDIDSLKLLTTRFLERYRGKTTMIYETSTGHRTNTNTKLSRINDISSALKALGLNTEQFEVKAARSKPTMMLKPGIVESHVKAFSHNGNGETIPENAVENGHRCNRDMTEEEYARLKKANRAAK